METSDELRTLRRRAQDIEDAADVVPPQRTGSPTVIGRVVDLGDIPTSVPNQFAVKRVRVTGQISEGMAATLTAGDKPFICTVLGPQVPVVDDDLLLRRVGGRWVGGTGGAGSPAGYVYVRVNGCITFVGVAGCTVELKDGSTVVSTGTTDVNGNVVLPFYTTPIGSLTTSATPPSGSMVWNATPRTGTVVFHFGTGLVSTVFLLANTGYPICCGAVNGFVDPFETTATLTDSNGTHTMTHHLGGPIPTSGSFWGCCYLLTGVADNTFVGVNCIAGGSAEVAVGYVLQCGNAVWTLYEMWTSCFPDPPLRGLPGFCGPDSDGHGSDIAGDLTDHTQNNLTGSSVFPGATHGRDPMTFTMANAWVNGTVAVSFP